MRPCDEDAHRLQPARKPEVPRWAHCLGGTPVCHLSRLVCADLKRLSVKAEEIFVPALTCARQDKGTRCSVQYPLTAPTGSWFWFFYSCPSLEPLAFYLLPLARVGIRVA